MSNIFDNFVHNTGKHSHIGQTVQLIIDAHCALLTFVLLLPALLRTSHRQRRDALRAGLPLGMLLLSIFLFETYGVAQTQASNAAFLISLCVVFTPFAEWWLLGRRPSQTKFVFAAISLLGATLLSGGLAGQFGLGDGLMLAAAMLRTITVCQTSKLTRDSTAFGAHIS